jgi:hypothetical protein
LIVASGLLVMLGNVRSDIGKELKVFADSFDHVPEEPGIYAWFYPFRLTSEKTVVQFLTELDYINEFDPKREGGFSIEADAETAWDIYALKVARRTKRIETENRRFEEIWQEIKRDDASREEFRKELYKSSILGRPLYVGKASNLYVRIQQHLNGKSGFANRFAAHVEAAKRAGLEVKFGARKIEDLLLVTIHTEKILASGQSNNNRPEDLMEHILKLATKPPFGLL